MNDKTKQNLAAQVSPLDAFVQEAIDQDSGIKQTGELSTESAPVEKQIVDANNPTPTEAEKPTGDGFQKRIDKVTADKYAEKRRADDLQKRIDAMDAKSKESALVKPKLDDPGIDYDEDAFAKANRVHDIKQGVQDELASRAASTKAEQQKLDSEKTLNTFNERVSALGKNDFDVKAQSIPELPTGVADAIMQSEKGAEMIYHLGSPENAEQANAIANMSPAMAMMELGKLSTQLSTKPEIKPSAAPDPITPVKAGSALSSDIGDDMSMEEWMAKFG